MNKILTVIIVLILAGLAFWYINNHVTIVVNSPSPTVSATNSASPVPSSSTSSISTPGGITFSYGGDFGVATKASQIPVASYIPPCDTQSMDYCLYYSGNTYKGTNFESAGLRIEKRAELLTKTACTNSLPDGYSNMVPTVTDNANYSTSVFSPISDAGAGHYANGAIYRLWFSKTCYEFETRVGETQYANYPPGAIQQFTDADRTAVNAELRSLLSSVTINSSGAKPFAQ